MIERSIDAVGGGVGRNFGYHFPFRMDGNDYIGFVVAECPPVQVPTAITRGATERSPPPPFQPPAEPEPFVLRPLRRPPRK